METYRVYMTPDDYTDIDGASISSTAGNVTVHGEDNAIVARFYNVIGWELLPPPDDTGIPTRPV